MRLKNALLAVALLAPAASPAGAAEPKRVMVFGDSIAWGYVPRAEGPPSTRYPADVRWPGAMAAELGPAYEVVEENLNGRVTDFTPDPSPVPLAGAGLNGAAYLPAAIASQMPLDLVIVALGTNDTGYRRTPLEIGLGAVHLATIVQDSAGGVAAIYPAPAVLLVAPPPLPASVAQGPLGRFYGEAAHPVSQAFGTVYTRLGEAAGVAVLDAGKVTRTDGADSVHLSAQAHAALGKAVALEVRKMLPPPG